MTMMTVPSKMLILSRQTQRPAFAPNAVRRTLYLLFASKISHKALCLHYGYDFEGLPTEGVGIK
jgi:hypothetical protein